MVSQCLWCELYIPLGQTGHGKSSFINKICGVSAPAGDSYDSVTKDSVPYVCTEKGWELFRGSVMIDSAGLGDTAGLEANFITESISVSAVQSKQTTGEVRAFFFIINTLSVRQAVIPVIFDYVHRFSESMCDSLVIVVNRFPGINDEQLERLQVHISNEIYNRLKKSIPVVVMDILNLNTQDEKNLKQAIQKVTPYKLADFDAKEKAITAIYDKMLNDPANYKKVLHQEIINTMHPVSRKEVVRTTKEVKRHVLVPRGEFSVGVVSFSKGARLQEVMEEVVVDEIQDVTHEEEHQEVKETFTDELINEKSVYWNLAVAQYTVNLRQSIFANN
jgi:GTP-binding protein EngB required for normal cell division